MKAEDLIYDILTILDQTSDDADVSEEFLFSKVAKYRVAMIQNVVYQKGLGYVDPIWVQDIPEINLINTTSADDPSILYSSITLGKALLPSNFVSIENAHNITSASRQIPGMHVPLSTLLLAAHINKPIHPDIFYYSLHGKTLYTWPNLSKAKAFGVFEEPTLVKVLENGVYRDFQLTDEYPCDMAMAQEIIIKILTIDFNLKNQQISDILNDAQDAVRLMRSMPRQ